MKILHLPTEIANQVIVTAKALKSLNQEANAANFSHHFGYEQDIVISTGSNRYIRLIDKIIFFVSAFLKYDTFHYHAGALLPFGLDAKILKLFKKKIFIEFWGSEVRLYDIEKKRNRFFVSDNLTDQNSKIKRLKFWSSITDHVIVSDHSLDPFLKPYFKKIHVVGQRIELEKYTPFYPSENTIKPIIVHAPSSKSTKGTEFVNKAIELLKNENQSFEYIEVFNKSHEEALKIYKTADIIIDQLLIGSYGILACECMALGKPVICYILDENIKSYDPDMPIVNANPETVADVLRDLILSPSKRHYIGKQGRIYAERVHDSKEVAKRLLKIYSENHA